MKESIFKYTENNQEFHLEEALRKFYGNKINQLQQGYKSLFFKKQREEFYAQATLKGMSEALFSEKHKEELQSFLKKNNEKDEGAGIVEVMENNRENLKLASLKSIYNAEFEEKCTGESMFYILHRFFKNQTNSQRPAADAFLACNYLTEQGINVDYTQAGDTIKFYEGKIVFLKDNKITCLGYFLGKTPPSEGYERGGYGNSRGNSSENSQKKTNKTPLSNKEINNPLSRQTSTSSGNSRKGSPIGSNPLTQIGKIVPSGIKVDENARSGNKNRDDEGRKDEVLPTNGESFIDRKKTKGKGKIDDIHANKDPKKQGTDSEKSTGDKKYDPKASKKKEDQTTTNDKNSKTNIQNKGLLGVLNKSDKSSYSQLTKDLKYDFGSLSKPQSLGRKKNKSQQLIVPSLPNSKKVDKKDEGKQNTAPSSKKNKPEDKIEPAPDNKQRSRTPVDIQNHFDAIRPKEDKKKEPAKKEVSKNVEFEKFKAKYNIEITKLHNSNPLYFEGKTSINGFEIKIQLFDDEKFADESNSYKLTKLGKKLDLLKKQIPIWQRLFSPLEIKATISEANSDTIYVKSKSSSYKFAFNIGVVNIKEPAKFNVRVFDKNDFNFWDDILGIMFEKAANSEDANKSIARFKNFYQFITDSGNKFLKEANLLQNNEKANSYFDYKKRAIIYFNSEGKPLLSINNALKYWQHFIIRGGSNKDIETDFSEDFRKAVSNSSKQS